MVNVRVTFVCMVKPAFSFFNKAKNRLKAVKRV